MPGLPPRRHHASSVIPPPNVTMMPWSGDWIQSNPDRQPVVVRQGFDVIARRRNPHYWTATTTTTPSVVGIPTSPLSGNSPLTPTPTPSPATPSPMSPAYPNRPVSVLYNLIELSFFMFTNFYFYSTVRIGGFPTRFSAVHVTQTWRTLRRSFLFYGWVINWK